MGAKVLSHTSNALAVDADIWRLLLAVAAQGSLGSLGSRCSWEGFLAIRVPAYQNTSSLAGGMLSMAYSTAEGVPSHTYEESTVQ